MKPTICGGLIATVFAFTSSLAADGPGPAGWKKSAYGIYSHTESGVTCPPRIGVYTLGQVDGPANPNFLGTCHYSDAEDRRGLIHVRRYMRGVGDTPVAIGNDQMLMEGTQNKDAPQGAKTAGTYRGGPGPNIGGEPTRILVQTTVKNGLLVDCVEWQKNSTPSLVRIGVAPFSQHCSELLGPGK